MRPYDFGPKHHGNDGILRGSHHDVDHCWILTDGFRVTIAEQKAGESPTQKTTIDRTTFNKLIAWYMRDQKPKSRKSR